MSKKKLRDLSAVLFVGLFLMTQELVFIWLLIGSIVLLHPENSESSEAPKNLFNKGFKDAKKYGLKIPKDTSIRQMLTQVYERVEQSKRLYPHLKEQYESVIEDLWKSLVVNSEKDQWRYLLSTILAEWPVEKHQPQNSLRKKLDEVKRLTHQWDDAKKEAYGDM